MSSNQRTQLGYLCIAAIAAILFLAGSRSDENIVSAVGTVAGICALWLVVIALISLAKEFLSDPQD